MFNNAFSEFFGASELEMDALAKCNQFGRFPILPLSTHLPAIHDGSLSDDSYSPITPLDAYNLSLHTLGYEKAEPYASQLGACLPMSALYAPPLPLPSDAESSSATDSSSPASEPALLPVSTRIVPSQASKKRAAPSDSDTPSAAAAAAPAPAAKKPRVSHGRVRAKDFVPPDVSGMTKREARLVKNRAAAFLSRQRKREEFEAMEVRLAELERDNAQLKRASSTGSELAASSPSSSTSDDALEPMQLQLSSMRQLLQAAEEREKALKAELEELRLETDASDEPRPNSKPASLGLMAVLSLSSVVKSASGGAWADGLALCDAQGGAPEIEVSCTQRTDGRLRVRLHRPSEQRQDEWPDFVDDDFASMFPPVASRVRLALTSAALTDDGAELEVEIR